MAKEKTDKLLTEAMLNPLSFEKAENMFELIMDGKVSNIQMSAFLTALKVRGESIDEITAAASIMRKKSLKVYGATHAVDIVGTGGDGKKTLNISTTSALTLASGGLPVAKHGNRAISSLSGSSDALKFLGIETQMNPDKAQECFNKFDFCFMMAPVYHPAMKNVMTVRQELGTRTIFNILGPLTNPASVNYQLIGVYNSQVSSKIAEVVKNLNINRAWVVHGDDGTDEISISGPTKVIEIDRGKIKSFVINPNDADLKEHAFEEIRGGSAEFNAAKIVELSNGITNGFFDSVLFNSAAGMYIAGKSDNIKSGVNLVKSTILDGKLKGLINNLKAFSSDI